MGIRKEDLTLVELNAQVKYLEQVHEDNKEEIEENKAEIKELKKVVDLIGKSVTSAGAIFMAIVGITTFVLTFWATIKSIFRSLISGVDS